MTEKDYSLLRPFDLDAAKAGGLMCERTLAKQNYTYVDGPDPSGWMVVKNKNGVFLFSTETNLFMLPLCWVEGKPVYPGDVLWQTTHSGDVLKRKAKQISADGRYLEFEETGSWNMDGSVSKLSWVEPPPKPVKRWVNVYPGMYRDGGPCSTTMHSTKEAAEADLMHGSIACVEIELPLLKQ